MRPSRDAPSALRTRRARHVAASARLRRRRARARPCGQSPGGAGRTIMKDSTSAASAGAELVLRRFPGAVLVRWPVPPPPETLSDRWLQAAEEEEEPLPFRSPPREENGTEPAGPGAGGPRGSLRGAPGSSAALRGAVASTGAAELTRKRREGWRVNGKGEGAGSEL